MATLYITATPIGNLNDLSPRAARILIKTSVIAAESFARIRKLLTYLNTSGKVFISCREVNRDQAILKIVQTLNIGYNVVLVSDSGTPGISDPGAWVVKAAVTAGHRLTPLPGPSALTSALSVAGIKTWPIIFLGFVPINTKIRKRILLQAAQIGWPIVFFETSYRLNKTARDLLLIFGDRPVVLTRELSKINEEVIHTTCRKLFQRTISKKVRGEITLILANTKKESCVIDDEKKILDLLREGLAVGLDSPSCLVKKVAIMTNSTRKKVYQYLLRLK